MTHIVLGNPSKGGAWLEKSDLLGADTCANNKEAVSDSVSSKTLNKSEMWFLVCWWYDNDESYTMKRIRIINKSI